MSQSPQNIRAVRQDQTLELVWPDGQIDRISFHTLRCACRCAACVDEITGAQILQPASVPADIAPQALSLSGNYALKVRWSDDHDTGLYTWERLRQLARPGEHAVGE